MLRAVIVVDPSQFLCGLGHGGIPMMVGSIGVAYNSHWSGLESKLFLSLALCVSVESLMTRKTVCC